MQPDGLIKCQRRYFAFFKNGRMDFEVTVKHNIYLCYWICENIYNYLVGGTHLLFSVCALFFNIDKAVDLYILQTFIMYLLCVWLNRKHCWYSDKRYSPSLQADTIVIKLFIKVARVGNWPCVRRVKRDRNLEWCTAFWLQVLSWWGV